MSYYGKVEILGVEKLKNDHVKLTMVEGLPIDITKKMYEAGASKKPVELGEARDNQIFAITKEILNVLESWDVKFDDVPVIMNRLEISLNNTIKSADIINWGKLREEIVLSDIQKVLSIPNVDKVLNNAYDAADKNKSKDGSTA